MSKNNIIYGKHAALAALQNPLRKVKAIYILPQIRQIPQIMESIACRNITEVNAAFFAKMLGKDAVHQGIALNLEPLHNRSFKEFIKHAASLETSVTLIMDKITDPHNFGAIARTAFAFGIDAIITTNVDSGHTSPIAHKCASGAMENLEIYTIANISQGIKELQDAGYWVFAMDAKGDGDISKIAEYKKKAIVLGSEGEGLRRLTREQCDMILSIPMHNNMESLNVSNAAAIAMYCASLKS